MGLHPQDNYFPDKNDAASLAWLMLVKAGGKLINSLAASSKCTWAALTRLPGRWGSLRRSQL
jgi:hypothetical protein